MLFRTENKNMNKLFSSSLLLFAILLTGCNKPVNLTGKWSFDITATAAQENLKNIKLPNDNTQELKTSLDKVLDSLGALYKTIEIKENRFFLGDQSCSVIKFSKTDGARCEKQGDSKYEYIGFIHEPNRLMIYLSPRLPPLIYKKLD